MKAIFLDIDGVLNTHYDYEKYGFDYLNQELIEILKKIVVETNSKIVLSSTWRLDQSDFSFIKQSLSYKNLQVSDITPYLNQSARSEEIKMWLDYNPHVEKFAILDDSSEAGNGLEQNFFKTDYHEGITEEIAKKIIKHLNN